MVRVLLVRMEYQLEMKVWLYMENMHNKHFKHCFNAVSICTYFTCGYNYCIPRPVSECVCEGSGGSCTGMRSLDAAWEVSGRMASFVVVVSAVQ